MVPAAGCGFLSSTAEIQHQNNREYFAKREDARLLLLTSVLTACQSSMLPLFAAAINSSLAVLDIATAFLTYFYSSTNYRTHRQPAWHNGAQMNVKPGLILLRNACRSYVECAMLSDQSQGCHKLCFQENIRGM